MTRFDLKRWIGTDSEADENHSILAFLRDTEAAFVRMIAGIVLFFVERIPEFLRKLIDWLHASLLLAVRVAVRLVRVAVVVLTWLGIAFGPMARYPGIICGFWMVLALTGSVWGLQRTLKKRALLAKTEIVGPDFKSMN